MESFSNTFSIIPTSMQLSVQMGHTGILQAHLFKEGKVGIGKQRHRTSNKRGERNRKELKAQQMEDNYERRLSLNYSVMNFFLARIQYGFVFVFFVDIPQMIRVCLTEACNQ